MQDIEIQKIYRKTAIIFIVMIILTLVVFMGALPAIKYLERPAFLDILVAPVEATITINDKQYHNAVYEMEPGRYTATVSMDGFKTITTELNLEKNKTTGLYTYLEPENGDWSFYDRQKNQESYEVLMRLKGYYSDGKTWSPALPYVYESDNAAESTNEFTVGSIMPLNLSSCKEPASRMTCNAVSVKYEYSDRCGNNLCLVITGRSAQLSQEDLNDIRDKLSEEGYDIDNYPYIYKQDTSK